VKTVKDVKKFLGRVVENSGYSVKGYGEMTHTTGSASLGNAIAMICEEGRNRVAQRGLDYIGDMDESLPASEAVEYVRSSVDLMIMTPPESASGHTSRIIDTFQKEGARRFWEDFKSRIG